MFNIIIEWLKKIFIPYKPVTGINCVIRLGLPGSGKTLDQTETDVIRHLLAGEEVWCCYWLNWQGIWTIDEEHPEGHLVQNYHQFSSFEEVEHLRNCVVVFDEIGQILPARQWELEGLRVQLFFQLHRHRHVDIIGNTQDVSLVAKTVGIVANSWLFCEKSNNRLIDLFISIFGLHYIVVRQTKLSYQGLKKMANGWEIEGVMNNDQKKQKHKYIWYNIDKIAHNELTQIKEELVHKYCNDCAMRQGTRILSHDTAKVCDYNPKTKQYTLKQVEYCKRHHKTKLTIRTSGLYDTDHEPEVKSKIITWQPMIDCEAGSIKVKYNGTFSETQIYEKEMLNKQIPNFDTQKKWTKKT